MSDNRHPRAVKACAAWLAYCLDIGWKKADLDKLEHLWWQHHDEFGQIKRQLPRE